ncbi:MAG: Rrf2 family transcriptional regulator [Lachnospiraceae bacterium]|nr:Rrf2 family transcriptional regulator [Lachnospiraceae bacterium]
MIVSTRVEYGLMALLDIAEHSENHLSVSTTEIAERQNISQKYLEQILPLLRQAGLIRAQKGLRGGYSLSRSANVIRLSEVLNALDGSILAGMSTTEDGQGSSLRGIVNECLWENVNERIREYAENRTLGDLLEECKRKAAGSWTDYII